MKMRQKELLNYIKRNDGQELNISELGRLFNLSRQAMHFKVRQLEKKGLIERVEREKEVKVTKKIKYITIHAK